MSKIKYILFFGLIISASTVYGQLNIYHEDYIDFNKNGKKDIYEDSKQPIEKRIANLLSQMNIDEKTAQLATLYGYGRVLKDTLPTENWKKEIWKDGIANIDEHLNSTTFRKKTFTSLSYPYSRHAESINTTQKWFIENTRLGIPVDFTNEGVHGLAHDRATLFPAQISLGSTWDKGLLKEVGNVIGRETKALGYTNVYVPILDLARDPRWGRVVECYGEDPFLVAELGKQMVLGVQSEDVAATLKHFAVYSMPKGGRDGNARTDPHVAPREMHAIYLYPFERVIKEAHPLGVMSSYNDWDGEPVTASYYFLTELLRKEFGFSGYVVSDSDAVEFIFSKHHVAKDKKDAVRMAFEAGLNVRTNFDDPGNYILPLRQLIKDSAVSINTLNSRVSDVLRVKFKLGLFDQPINAHPENADKIVNNEAAKKTAKQASRECLVLLKNENSLLPLDKLKNKNILVTGPLAADTLNSMSRYGPNNVRCISVLKGLKEYLGNNVLVSYQKGCETIDATWPESELFPQPLTDKETKDIQEAVDKAKQSDVVIAVLGEEESLVGESRSRTSLDLPGRQLQLLQALETTGKPIILVLINGRPLTINWANKFIPSILEAWFPGKDGGTAIAETIFGDYNPGGKLSTTFPKSIGQIEYNFPFKPGSHVGQPGDGPNGFGKTNVYGCLYPFGYGLSYTTFSYNNLVVNPAIKDLKGEINVSVEVTNSGKIKGDEVVQLYFKEETSSVTVYETQLRGFERVSLNPGETKTVKFKLNTNDFRLMDKQMHWVLESGAYDILIGSSSEDIRFKKQFIIQNK